MSISIRLPISRDVSEVIGDFAQHVDNRSLLLDKFILHKSYPRVDLIYSGKPMKLDNASRWSFIRIAQNGDIFFANELEKCNKVIKGKNVKEENKEKAEIDKELLEKFKKCACRRLPSDIEKQKLQQNKAFAQAIERQLGLSTVVYGELQGRLIINLSDSLIQNAGISLDRNTGLPFIPGSAVKGVVRHVALAGLRNGTWTLDEFMRVFGTSDADFKNNGELIDFSSKVDEKCRNLKGGVDFLSAHPITEPQIMVDISTVHYPEYYQTGELSLLKKEELRPNTFPVVEKGVRYAFCVAANKMNAVDKVLFNKVREALVEAITVYGIGAKTAAGYGWFNDITNIIIETEKRQQEQIEAKRLAEECLAKAQAEKAAKKEEMERRASLSPCERVLEKWAKAPNLKAIVNGDDIRKFDKCSDEEKTGIVEALRQSDGIGAKVWAIVKGSSPDDSKRKLYNANVDQQIRAYCKNTLKLGKMP